jgi:hypothetical protein
MNQPKDIAMTSRRQFIFKTIPVVALTISASGLTQAQAQKIAETDAAATALGYKNDATKVDAKKFLPMRLEKPALTACCIKVKQLTAGVPAVPWATNWLMAKAGVQPGRRKRKFV